jgi:hypothetical protein
MSNRRFATGPLGINIAKRDDLPKIPNNLARQIERLEEWVAKLKAARQECWDARDNPERLKSAQSELLQLVCFFSDSDASAIIWNARKMIEFGLETDHPYMRAVGKGDAA